MHEHIAPVSTSADTGSVLNNLTMKVARFPFIACTFDTILSVVLGSGLYTLAKGKILGCL